MDVYMVEFFIFNYWEFFLLFFFREDFELFLYK